MKKYYYSSHDKVWSAWSDSELKSWLVKHGLLESDTQKKRDELVKTVEYVVRLYLLPGSHRLTGKTMLLPPIAYGTLGMTQTFVDGFLNTDTLMIEPLRTKSGMSW